MGQRKKILLVDDDPAWVAILTRLIGEQGYTVKGVGSVEDALQALPAFKPDLILSDIRMPDLNGFDFLAAVKASESNAKVPVIFFSGIDDFHSREVAEQLGASDYLVKPFDEHELIDIIRKHLGPAPGKA